jgi:type II secretory pathway pseudopilin PulG
MRVARQDRAFTFVELLVGLQITSILLAAIATMAFAMSTAARHADETMHSQASLRYAALRVGELIRTCRLVCAAPGRELVFWMSDDNGNGQIDINEVVYLEYDEPGQALRLLQFNVPGNPTVLAALGQPETDPILTALAESATKTALETYAGVGQIRRVTLLAGCSNVAFAADPLPPRTRQLAISYDLAANGGPARQEIGGTLRTSAQHLLSPDASTLVSDDD